MKRLLTLPTILVSILALSPVSSNAAVTWAAQGLPPGLSINASTGAITGKPTQAGNYTVIIYPKNGSAVGNMGSIKITVLPAGVNLPTYYAYYRLTSSGDYLGSTIAGGGGYIWGLNQTLNIPEVTTNGVTFSEPSLPPVITSAVQGNGKSLAACGNKALYLGMDSSFSTHCMISTRGGAFYETSLPQGFGYSDGSSLASDGSNFYIVNYDGGGGSLNVWKSSAQNISWAQIASISLNVNSWQGPTASAAIGSNAVVVAFQGIDGAGLLISNDGGNTFTNDTSNSQIKSVAFGNRKFLGTGDTGTGVWSSTDGQNWAQISSIDPGNIIYSSYEKLFFSSSGGVSSDGIYWQPYQNGSFGGSYNVASSGTGLVFVGGCQLSTNNIPNYSGGTFQTSVGKATTINATH